MKSDPDDIGKTKTTEENDQHARDNTKINRISSQLKRKLLNPTAIALATLIVTTAGIIISTVLDLPSAILNSRALSHEDTAPSLIPPPSNRPESRASTDSKHAQQETSSTTEAPLSSGCYDGDTPTPCDSPHSREVFAKPAGSPCDASALILYMGGVPGVDLLASGIDAKPLENTEDRCVVESRRMPHVSLKDIWTSDNDHNGYKDGGEFRRCFTRQGQATSCDATTPPRSSTTHRRRSTAARSTRTSPVAPSTTAFG